MRFVAINTEGQQDTQMLHRIRSRLVAEPTALINQVRGLLGEYEIVFAQGPSQVRRGMACCSGRKTRGSRGWLMNFSPISTRSSGPSMSGSPTTMTSQSRLCHGRAQREARGVTGIGPLTATALAAAVNDGKEFDNGRQMAASLGLTPREHSSGGKQRLMGITKRGNTYVRTLLIHGARTTCPAPCRGQARPPLPLGFGRAGKARGECRGRGTGQQTRPHRLGGAGPRSDIPGGLGGAIRLTPTGKLLSRGVFDSKHTTDCEGEEPRDGKTG